QYFTQVFSIPFFIWSLSGITWLIGLGSPSQHTIDMVGVYFPAILAALAVIPVYIIGREMFGKMAGIIAAITIAILPGEWLGRSILGFTDDHVAEVLLSTTALMFFVLALKSGSKKRIAFTVLAAVFMVMYLSTFRGGVIFVGIIAVYFLTQIIFNTITHHRDRFPITLLVLGTAGITLFIFAAPETISNMAMYMEAIGGNTGITTMEMRPILFPNSTFTLAVVWAQFGFLCLLIPTILIGLIIRAVKTGHSGTILLAIWSIVTLVLMLEYRRFSYYFAINVSLLTGWFLWYLWQHLKSRNMAYAVVSVGVLFLMAVVPNTQVAFASARIAPYTPPDAWCEALEWVENNTPEDSIISAWWDYGYWIDRISHRKAYVNPSQDPELIKNTANAFLSDTPVDLEADYIILDYSTTAGKFWAIATWTGESPLQYSERYNIIEDGNIKPVILYYPEYYQSLAVRLYNFSGQAVIPTQSTVIQADGANLISVETYATYEEAVLHTEGSQRLIGTSPFVSPVLLGEVEEYTLVYESKQLVNGIPEVKIFRKG
ncbi:MAG: glycosyltransferase family 39 protein, partial [Gammaproteobacteria bacterium]|nr:glycosyltransferase family 39 protein [Gammaproteobacteria bacterium]